MLNYFGEYVPIPSGLVIPVTTMLARDGGAV